MYPTTYLQPGSSNRTAVRQLQNYLVKSGHMTQAQMNTGPGIYGPRTTNAVASLQRALGVDTSGGGIGYFGPRTLKAVKQGGIQTPPVRSTPAPVATQPVQTPVVPTAPQTYTPPVQTQPTQTQQPNIVDRTLKDFNTAIVNKDYTKLKQLGATIPVNSVVKNTPLPVTQTTPIDIPPVTTTPTPVTLTPQQTQASALSDKIQALNTSMTGETQFKADQNKLAGVDKIQQAVNDNNLAIERLNASAGQASLTAENRLAPMFQISGEQAQINRQRSFQMLGLSAISDALRNNLVSAQQKVTEAVQLKYGTIENQIKADTANLSLVLHSPEATLSEKKQANQMLQANRVKANDMLVQRQNQENIFKVMTLSAQNKDNFTPTSEYPTLSMAMQAITQAKTPQDALVIATDTGLTAPAKKSGSFSLSAGQTRYDAQGNVIARGAPKTVKSTSTSSQLKTFLNKQIATKDFQSLSAEDKKLYIRSQGADPYNFGY